MKITDILDGHAVAAQLTGKNKKEVIEELVDLLVASGKVSDRKRVVQKILEREELGSTGIGQGIAIPHGKSDGVKELAAAFGLSRVGVNFDALDGAPVQMFFLLVAPESAPSAHLKALARVSALLKDRYFRRTLQAATNADEMFKAIREEDAKH